MQKTIKRFNTKYLRMPNCVKSFAKYEMVLRRLAVLQTTHENTTKHKLMTWHTAKTKVTDIYGP